MIAVALYCIFIGSDHTKSFLLIKYSTHRCDTTKMLLSRTYQCKVGTSWGIICNRSVFYYIYQYACIWNLESLNALEKE